MTRRGRLLVKAALLVASLPFALTARSDDAKPSQEVVRRRVEEAIPGFRFKAIKQAPWFEGFRHRVTGTDAAGHPVSVILTAWGNIVRVDSWFHRDPAPDLDRLIQIAALDPEMWDRVTRIVRVTKADGHVSEWQLMGIDMKTGKETLLAAVVVDRLELDDRDKPET